MERIISPNWKRFIPNLEWVLCNVHIFLPCQETSLGGRKVPGWITFLGVRDYIHKWKGVDHLWFDFRTHITILSGAECGAHFLPFSCCVRTYIKYFGGGGGENYWHLKSIFSPSPPLAFYPEAFRFCRIWSRVSLINVSADDVSVAHHIWKNTNGWNGSSKLLGGGRWRDKGGLCDDEGSERSRSGHKGERIRVWKTTNWWGGGG